MAFRKVNDDSLATVAAAIRAKGGISEQLAFPDGFVSAIGDIQAGGGSLDHSVTFKDYSGNVVAVYSVIDGIGGIYSPTGVEASKWVCDGTDITFPITPTSNMVLIADNKVRLSEMLYGAYDVSPETYPVILLTTGTNYTCDFYFCKSITRYSDSGNVICYANDYYGYWNIPIVGTDPSIASSVVSCLVQNKPTLSKGSATSCAMGAYRFSHGLDISTYPLFAEIDT